MLILIIVIDKASATDAIVNSSNKIVTQGQTFNLSIVIDPKGTAIAGAQLNIAFNKSILNVNSVTEGNLFKQSGASTFFNNGTINNSLGTVTNIYSAIIGPFNVSTPGTFIIINATAVGSSGLSGINLSNVKISDPNGVEVAVDVINESITLNSPPVLAAIGNKIAKEEQLLTFTVSATDADNDTIIYGTNATKGTFNTTTGNFSWIPSYSDAGVYTWYFNASDSYGGVANETIIVTVNNVPLSITSFSPSSDPVTIQGTVQNFSITLNRAANVTWYMNGAKVQIDTSITSASYTNPTAGVGTWNVTASATDNIDTISRTWNWTINAQPPITYIPPDPTNLQNTTGNFWVNYTWQAGAGNITNLYNVRVNGTWYNGTTNIFINTTTTPHGWVNITVWAYNSSGTGLLSPGSVSQNTQEPDNPPILAPIGNKTVNEGQTLIFTISATDADGDFLTYSASNLPAGASFSPASQTFQWTPSFTQAGIYPNVHFEVSDGTLTDFENITITVKNIRKRSK